MARGYIAGMTDYPFWRSPVAQGHGKRGDGRIFVDRANPSRANSHSTDMTVL